MYSLKKSPLGKNNSYTSQYQPDLLFPIPREINRNEINVPVFLPFKGVDIWNAYEISWLNTKGKPIVALATFIFPCESPNIVESKSFKLYLNSFNNTQFATIDNVIAIMKHDLSKAVGANIEIQMFNTFLQQQITTTSFTGICLDPLDIACDTYQVNANFLTTEDNIISETVYSDLLKSNCLVTGQPDWGSVQIEYTGKKIQHEGLLKYIISFRNCNEFGEQCVERIFMDIMRICSPEKLSVQACYTRRGGLDINPCRSTESKKIYENTRLIRQ